MLILIDPKKIPFEIIFLKPIDDDSKSTVAYECLMVEAGLAFMFDEDGELPENIPDDMPESVKVIAIDEDSYPHYNLGKNKIKLKKFKEEGGKVHLWRRVDYSTAIDENNIRGDLEMTMATIDLQIPHPVFRSELQNRSFYDLFNELKAPYFMGQIYSSIESKIADRCWNEPYNYGVLDTMLLLYDVFPEEGWLQKLHQVVLEMIHNIPNPMINMDNTSPLGSFLKVYERTGDTIILDYADKHLKMFYDSTERINGVPVLAPGRDKLLWNEVSAHLMQYMALLGKITHDDQLIKDSINCIRILHEFNSDSKKKLWYHAGKKGWHTPAVWGRGQAWAIYGIVGVLEVLDHRFQKEKNLLLSYLENIFEALLVYQTDEGLWKNVIDDSHSRDAVRASAMIVSAFCKVKKNNWIIDERLDKMLHLAWGGVKGRLWKQYSCTVCCGTGANYTYQSYLARPHIFYGAMMVINAGASYVLAFRDLDQ